MALKARLKAVGRFSTSSGGRVSAIGAGCGTAGPTPAKLKATPVRTVLGPVNYAAPASTQSKRMSSVSCQSQASSRRRDTRPFNNAAYKKHCIDTIFTFLTENGYCNVDSSLLQRRVLSTPSNKDFASIFTFIYGMIEPNFQLSSRFADEIPMRLKHLSYPSQIPKSTFASVGSPHSWPTLLTMLAWMCNLVQMTSGLVVEEIAYPIDFDNEDISIWEHLNCYLDAASEPEIPGQYEHCLMNYREAVQQQAGVDGARYRQLEEEIQMMALQEQQLTLDRSPLQHLQIRRNELESDEAKLDDFNAKMRLKLKMLDEEKQKALLHVVSLHSQKTELVETVDRLSAMKSSQKYSQEELLCIKNHARTSLATLQQLQEHGKRTQNKIYDLELGLCRRQVTLSALIQEHNASPAASVVGPLVNGRVDRQTASDEPSDSEHPMKRNDVASAPLLVEDIVELSDKLAEELRVARAKVVEAYALRRKHEEQCRKYEQIVEDKKLQGTQLEMRIRSAEEDICYSLQEMKTKEEAKLDELAAQQQQLSCRRRRAPNTELYALQEKLHQRGQQIEARKEQTLKMAREGERTISLITTKIEECIANNPIKNFAANISRIIKDTGKKEGGA
ncbi:kinetochore protein NDC80 homolog [Hyalella azteca]|uniref:Kinetochore protein NDC80 n=1 Tax=Hyalella azteca TaxID=294128 RepID=A0A8B7P632_HYAAZ|nr:kinetochore protein NDC80 homolog [Hyalella azteca]